MLKVNGINTSSLVDGEGIRYTIFFQGCPHEPKCDGCHSPHTWNIDNYNIELSAEQIIADIKRYKRYLSGITLSGGDPLMQIREVIDLVKKIKQDRELKHMDIWMWTGYNFEEIPKSFLQYIDVVVDGKYNKDLPAAKWRGSNNQKIYRKIHESNLSNKWRCDEE